MGYYTRHKLKVFDWERAEDKTDEFRQVRQMMKAASLLPGPKSIFSEEFLNKMRSAQVAFALLDKRAWECIEAALNEGDSQQWNEHNDMIALSKAFPDYVFELSGEGEEAGDVWTKWFCRGKHQGGKAEIVLPKFDPKAWVK